MPPEENKTELVDKKGESLKSIRTFRSDALEAVQGGGQSLTQIALAEQNRRRLEEVPQKREIPWNSILIGASIVFFLGAGFLIFWLFSKKDSTALPPPSAVSEDSIFTEEQKNSELQRVSSSEIQRAVSQELQTKKMPINAIEAIHFLKKVEVGTGQTLHITNMPVGIDELLGTPQGTVPQSLLRSFSGPFLFGFHSYIENQPFLIIKTNSHDNAFSGMLQWEKTMAEDLAPLFALRRETLQKASSAKFHDAIIKNYNVRLLEDANKNTFLLYSFVNRETLVIATNQTTFDELVKRIFAPKEIRQ